MKTRLLFITVLSLSTALTHSASAQQFTPDLDNEAGWTIVGTSDTAYEFGFDYSKFGIPSPPNGEGTTGLWMAANITEGVDSRISATPDAGSFSGQYEVQFDFFLNFNSSGGTTEFGGGFVGFDPAAASPFSGAGLIGNTDGDSPRDYRLYKDVNEQFIESEQYDISSQDNSEDADLMAKFPGQSTPAAQGDAAVFNPTNAIVTAPDGTLGYGWHTMKINVDSGAGTANFLIDDFSIGTINSNVGDAVNLEGQVALSFADIFPSVSTKPEFSFGVFDNLTVTQVPEPSSALLSIVGLIGLLRLRKKK